MAKDTCTSTKRRITNEEGSVKFLCPKCGQTTIVRSALARRLAARYKCEKCGFSGPN